ncbi:glycosyltransferase, partial [Kibdelosporangium lantanae]
MHLTHGRDVLIGETAAELADHIVTLLDDDKLWRRMSDDGKAVLDANFGPDVARQVLTGVLD